MRSVTRQVTMYIAADGREFTDKEECRLHEQNTAVDFARKQEMKYYEILYSPETMVKGSHRLRKIMYLAVDIAAAISPDSRSVALHFAHTYLGNPLVGVDFGDAGKVLVDSWSIVDSTRSNYENSLSKMKTLRDANFDEVTSIFISDRGDLDGYPTAMDMDDIMGYSAATLEAKSIKKPFPPKAAP